MRTTVTEEGMDKQAGSPTLPLHHKNEHHASLSSPLHHPTSRRQDEPQPLYLVYAPPYSKSIHFMQVDFFRTKMIVI